MQMQMLMQMLMLMMLMQMLPPCSCCFLPRKHVQMSRCADTDVQICRCRCGLCRYFDSARYTLFPVISGSMLLQGLSMKGWMFDRVKSDETDRRED
jgi:hypothetical protein